MTDNETNLAKWTAFARASDPEAVGHTLNELAGEIGRLRGVCLDAAERVARQCVTPKQVSFEAYRKLNDVARDLANEGSKDGK